MGENSASKTQVIVAVLALLGVLATAIFSNWDKLFPPSVTDGVEDKSIVEKPVKVNDPVTENSAIKPIAIDSNGAQATAKAGNSQISEYNRADILISAYDNKTGSSISSLNQRGHLGNARTLIPLPAGWTLHTKLVPAYGCTLKPTHIYNDGKGNYTLSVMTAAKNGPCPWKKGEYHYSVEINVNPYKGRTLGKIVIK